MSTSSSTNRHTLARLRRLLDIMNIDLGDLSVERILVQLMLMLLLLGEGADSNGVFQGDP